MGISILGMGSYVPDQIMTNDDFTRFVETDDELLVEVWTDVQDVWIELDEILDTTKQLLALFIVAPLLLAT